MSEEIKEKIRDAEMLLVGIGEEFDGEALVRDDVHYRETENDLLGQNMPWMLPLARYEAIKDRAGAIQRALEQLRRLIQGRDYYVVSTCSGGLLESYGFGEERSVFPCGSFFGKQCPDRCPEGLLPVTEEERAEALKALHGKNLGRISFGKCPVCGKPLVLNNVFYENYDENGYLEKWEKYTGWLQGTLNRKLCILELGVNMDCPTVIRFPFEKIAFYNQKATFIRVNEKLYQLPDHLADRGISVPQNSIDWLSDYGI